jgi:Apea-like HEPN
MVMLDKVVEWCAKAEHDDDPFDRYVSYFIAFNILYNTYAVELRSGVDLSTGDRTRAVGAGNLITNASLAIENMGSALTDYIRMIPIYGEEYWHTWGKPDIPISQSLKESFDHRDHPNTIMYLLMWLYKVRCNLVHGGKGYGDPKQRTLLIMSSDILARLLDNLISNYRAGYPI